MNQVEKIRWQVSIVDYKLKENELLPASFGHIL